jgi:hypothetical protein
MEFTARRGKEPPVTLTAAWDCGFGKGAVVLISGLTNSQLNGEYTITKVKRFWRHWYDPIIVFFKRIGLWFTKQYWRIRMQTEPRSFWVVTAYAIAGLTLFGVLAYFAAHFLAK